MMNGFRTIYTCFPEGKHKVLTMSYDDGRLEDYKLVEIFNKYGIKGTFHINALLERPDMIPLSEMKDLYVGHEVSCHTATHPTIARCPKEQIIQQIVEDRRALEETVGYPVRGLSYPNGSYNQEIMDMLPGLGIKYARTVGSTDTFAFPKNYLEWTATCHHNHNLMQHGQEFVDLFKKQYLYLMYVWGHSFEFGRDNNFELIEDFCKLVGGRDDIWYATNIQIVDYMEAAARLQYTMDSTKVYNPNAISIWISVDDEIKEIPSGKLVEI